MNMNMQTNVFTPFNCKQQQIDWVNKALHGMSENVKYQANHLHWKPMTPAPDGYKTMMVTTFTKVFRTNI
ncbi:hypothetical protein HanIR_Chr09g0446241 [Helianthus annuus]|nr:hypothetical protein HanIR_Chr09g0446241 [Helianthus annuus]